MLHNLLSVILVCFFNGVSHQRWASFSKELQIFVKTNSKEAIQMFDNTKSNFGHLLESLVNLDQQRIKVLNSLHQLQNARALHNVLQSGNVRSRGQDDDDPSNVLVLVVPKSNETNTRRNMNRDSTIDDPEEDDKFKPSEIIIVHPDDISSENNLRKPEKHREPSQSIHVHKSKSEKSSLKEVFNKPNLAKKISPNLSDNTDREPVEIYDMPEDTNEERNTLFENDDKYVILDNEYFQDHEGTIDTRKNWKRCLGKDAARLCKKSCYGAYKDACVRLKCSSSAKRSLKRQCRSSCNSRFK